jgi:hypothetical protein
MCGGVRGGRTHKLALIIRNSPCINDRDAFTIGALQLLANLNVYFNLKKWLKVLAKKPEPAEIKPTRANCMDFGGAAVVY